MAARKPPPDLTITERRAHLDLRTGHLALEHVHGRVGGKGRVQSTLFLVPSRGELVLERAREPDAVRREMVFPLSPAEADQLLEALTVWRSRRVQVSPSDPTP